MSHTRRNRPLTADAPRRPSSCCHTAVMATWLTIAATLAVLSTSAEGRIWHVNADGSGDSAMIQGAVNLAMSGDSVFIAAGVYDENVVVPAGLALLVRGTGANNVAVVDGGHRAPVLTVRGTATIENLTLRNGRGSAGAGVAFLGSRNSTIRHCIIEDNFTDAPSPGDGGGIYTHFDTQSITIEYNVIRRNQAYDNGGGVYLRGTIATPSGHRLRFNQILENSAYLAGGGVGVFDAHVLGNVIWKNTSVMSGGGLYVPLDGTALVEHNTVADNHIDNPVGGGGIHADGRPSIVHNIVALNTDASGLAYGIACTAFAAQPLVSCNDIWGNGRDEVLCGVVSNDNISVDPQFCSSSLADFRLAASSPCLPTGGSTCGLLGALGVGCGVVAVEPRTWSDVKLRFR